LPIKEAAAQAGSALSATAQEGAMSKEAAAQVGATHTATAQPGVMTMGAAAQAGAALTVTAQAENMAKGPRASASDAGRLAWLLSSRLTAIPPPVIKKPPRWGPGAF